MIINPLLHVTYISNINPVTINWYRTKGRLYKWNFPLDRYFSIIVVYSVAFYLEGIDSGHMVKRLLLIIIQLVLFIYLSKIFFTVCCHIDFQDYESVI